MVVVVEFRKHEADVPYGQGRDLKPFNDLSATTSVRSVHITLHKGWL